MTSRPLPTGPTLNACKMVAAPLTTSIANTAHASSASEPSTAWTRTMGNRAIGAMTSSADWTPRPSVVRGGGLSCGSYWGVEAPGIVLIWVARKALSARGDECITAGVSAARS